MAMTLSSFLLSSFLCLLLLAVAASVDHEQELPTPTWPPIARPGCPDRCGNVSIPYPFGTKDGCFLPGFFVFCNHSLDPPRPFLDAPNEILVEDLYYLMTNLTTGKEGYQFPMETKPTRSAWPVELVSVSPSEGKARLLVAFSYECRLNETHRSVRRQSKSISYRLSTDDNVLVGIGIGVSAKQSAGASCGSASPRRWDGALSVNGACSGFGCCQAMPDDDSSGMVEIEKRPVSEGDYYNWGGGAGGRLCSYAMIVEKAWYNFSAADLYSDAFMRRNADGVVPIVADFTMNIGVGACPKAPEPTTVDYPCVSNNSKCMEQESPGGTLLKTHYCSCSDGYQGNPYVLGGCQDIDECGRSDMYPCHGKCQNTPGDYECSCPAGTRGNAKEGPCTDLFSLPAKISLGMVGGLLIIALLVFTILIRKQKRKMAEFFNKNGGPTLEKAKIIKIYKKGELNPILKPSNFIGKGAFGEVYKGFLDNQLVAVKKPISGSVEVGQNDQFANEVIIQSQVIHKNIVRLIGCCLEVDKPMLVYEFLSKGSLDDILHGSSCVPLTLECRLNIASESAEGLAYLHSKTTNIILHGDVKPANILLNDNFTPKISDFGISRLIVMDKEHTDFVIGDRTYMDPVYLRDGLLTDKSDVYSFGVVLLELISRKKATYSDNNSLVRNFLNAHKIQKEPTELFDKDIAKPKDLNLLNSVYEIAVNCLNLDVDKRPNMIEVAENLLMLKRSWSNTLTVLEEILE